jgi:Lrp/AsnC family transcriptional regulator, leucine-responsive regulatory protein
MRTGVLMLDRTEIAILRVLEEDARLSYAELADKVALSKTPCWARVRDLEQRGVIKGYRTELDPGQLGLQIHAFIHATINPVKHAEFEAAAIRHRSVLQCFTTAGEGDYLLHVLVPSIADLDQILRAEISRMPGVQRSMTTVCLKTIKDRSSLIGCLR